MKIRILGLVLGLGALATWATSCDQPTIDCRSTRGSFSATYKLVNGTGACAELKGDIVGLQSYYPKAADSDTVDLSKSLLAIRASHASEVADTAALAKSCGANVTIVPAPLPPETPTSPERPSSLSSVGDFTSVDPDADNICTVVSPAAVEVSFTEVPATMPEDPDDPCTAGIPATSVKYEWRNVRLFVSPDAPGNRFEADLTYTENTCVATYKVCGVWPAIGCGKLEMKENAEGELEAVPVVDADGNQLPEQKLCDDQPDNEPQYAIPAGSGINIDFKPVCDPDLLICVLPQCPFL